MVQAAEPQCTQPGFALFQNPSRGHLKPVVTPSGALSTTVGQRLHIIPRSTWYQHESISSCTVISGWTHLCAPSSGSMVRLKNCGGQGKERKRGARPTSFRPQHDGGRFADSFHPSDRQVYPTPRRDWSVSPSLLVGLAVHVPYIIFRKA